MDRDAKLIRSSKSSRANYNSSPTKCNNVTLMKYSWRIRTPKWYFYQT